MSQKCCCNMTLEVVCYWFKMILKDKIRWETKTGYEIFSNVTFTLKFSVKCSNIKSALQWQFWNYKVRL